MESTLSSYSFDLSICHIFTFRPALLPSQRNPLSLITVNMLYVRVLWLSLHKK